MPSLMRAVRRNRWYKELTEHPWITPTDFPGDPLADLATDRCALSVFAVTDALAIQRVATAIAATRENFSNFDYILIDEETLINAGIKLNLSVGWTPDEEINTWHKDVIELSASNLFHLAEILWRLGTTNRINELEIKNSVLERMLSGKFDRRHVNKKLLEKIEKN